MQLLSNGEVVTTAIRTVLAGSSGKEVQQQVIFHSKGIVLGNGGVQEIHPLFFKEWFPSMKKARDRVIKSDWFLQRQGYAHTMDRIVRHKMQNIVIIGGLF